MKGRNLCELLERLKVFFFPKKSCHGTPVGGSPEQFAAEKEQHLTQKIPLISPASFVLKANKKVITTDAKCNPSCSLYTMAGSVLKTQCNSLCGTNLCLFSILDVIGFKAAL